jgi:DNA-binding MarR family transcriptional regulator
MRAAVTPAITVPQLRTLLFVGRNPEVNLSALADHLGIGITGASGLVDRLVKHGLLSRQTDPEERRRIKLTVTAQGRERLDDSVAATREAVAHKLAQLTPDEIATVDEAMLVLRATFGDL